MDDKMLNYIVKLNETEIKSEENKSSSWDILVEVRNKPPLISKSATCEKKLEKESSSRHIERKEKLVDFEKFIAEYKAKLEQERMNSLVEKLTEILVRELVLFEENGSEISSAERKILEIEEKYNFRVLGEVLQDIYVRYNDYPNILAGICKGLGRFEVQDVQPWGPAMLAGLLGHKNETVKEYAVALIENWADVSILPILRNIECKSKWLQEYISDVVEYLEGYNVLHKKIV